MSRFRGLFPVFFILTVFLAAPLTALAGVYGQTYEFQEPELTPAPDGTVVPEIPGTESLLAELGSPVVPFRIARILIPSGEKVTSIRVEAADSLPLPGFHKVQHNQGFRPLSDTGPFQPAPEDPAIYGRDAFFPYHTYASRGAQTMNGYHVALVALYPVVYNPVSGVLAYRPSITVVVETATARAAKNELGPRASGADLARVLRMVDNPQALATGRFAITTDQASAADRQYLVITTSGLATAFDTLLAYRASAAGGGYATHLETTEYIEANYPGVDLAEKIRNYIIDCYANHGTQFVLLGGDADGNGNVLVPTRGCCAVVTGSALDSTDASSATYTDNNIPTDFYYACLDGTWNHDGDALWGEKTDGVDGGDIDWYPEVYVGRIAADNATEVQNQVAKIIAYETAGELLYNTLLVGEKLDTNPTWGGDNMDYLYGYMEGMPSSTLYDRDAIWAKASLVSRLNSNTFDLVNHLGHSSSTYNMKMGTADVTALTNTSYFLLYTQGCYAGAFDSSDSIAETFTCGTSGKAAFAVIANSRYGWYYQGTLVWLASNLAHRRFLQQLFTKTVTLGQANDVARSQLDHSDGLYRWISFETNLLGDPATRFRGPWSLGGAPFIYPIPDQAGHHGQSFTATQPGVSGTEPITWSLVSGPAGLTIDSSTGVVSWTEADVTGSPYTVTLAASNDFGNDQKSFTLTILADPPVMDELDDAQARQGTPFSGPTPSVSGYLPITWSLGDGPTGMTIDESTGQVSWSSPVARDNPYLITIRAANAFGSDEKSFNLTVLEGPVLSSEDWESASGFDEYAWYHANGIAVLSDGSGNPGNCLTMGGSDGGSEDEAGHIYHKTFRADYAEGLAIEMDVLVTAGGDGYSEVGFGLARSSAPPAQAPKLAGMTFFNGPDAEGNLCNLSLAIDSDDETHAESLQLPQAFQSGVWNQAKMIIGSDGKVRFFLNGRLLWTTSKSIDPAYLGIAAFYIRGFDTRGPARVDNLNISHDTSTPSLDNSVINMLLFSP